MLTFALTTAIIVVVAICDSQGVECTCAGCKRIARHCIARRDVRDAQLAADARYNVEEGPYR